MSPPDRFPFSVEVGASTWHTGVSDDTEVTVLDGRDEVAARASAGSISRSTGAVRGPARACGAADRGGPAPRHPHGGPRQGAAALLGRARQRHDHQSRVLRGPGEPLEHPSDDGPCARGTPRQAPCSSACGRRRRNSRPATPPKPACASSPTTAPSSRGDRRPPRAIPGRGGSPSTLRSLPANTCSATTLRPPPPHPHVRWRSQSSSSGRRSSL